MFKNVNSKILLATTLVLGLFVALIAVKLNVDTRSQASTANLKSMGAGLYIRDAVEPTQPFIDHVFINVDWKELEPTRGSYTGSGWSKIDTFLGQNPNAKLRLRVKAGSGSPTWLNSISGQCVNIKTPDGETGCIPRFWTDNFMVEYRKLMTEVARKYESHPRVLDVVNGACGTLSAEPFILGGSEAGDALNKAGLNKQNHEKCIVDSTSHLNELFPTTRLSLASHVVWQVARPGGIDRDWPSERELLQRLRAIYGEKLILQNNGMANQTCSVTPNADTAGDLYCYMKAISIPKGFQQGCGNKVSTCNSASVADYAIKLGGCFLEHANYRELGASAQAIDTKLKANCHLSPTTTVTTPTLTQPPTSSPTAFPTSIPPTLVPTRVPTSLPTPTLIPSPTGITKPALTVGSITMSYTKSGRDRDIKTVVKVIDHATGKVVSNTKVFITIMSPANRLYIKTDTTNSNGLATFRVTSRELGLWRSIVTEAAKTGYVYTQTTIAKTLTVN